MTIAAASTFTPPPGSPPTAPPIACGTCRGLAHRRAVARACGRAREARSAIITAVVRRLRARDIHVEASSTATSIDTQSRDTAANGEQNAPHATRLAAYRAAGFGSRGDVLDRVPIGAYLTTVSVVHDRPHARRLVFTMVRPDGSRGGRWGVPLTGAVDLSIAILRSLRQLGWRDRRIEPMLDAFASVRRPFGEVAR